MLKIFSKIFLKLKTSLTLIIEILFLSWKTIRIIFGFGTCKFIPSCSEYTLNSIKKHGLIIGLYFSTKRILRCNPFSKGGYDPVP